MGIKTLMIGNHPSVKGGITSVISQIRDYNWETKNIDMHFIPTYIESGIIRLGIYYFTACIKIILDIVVWKPDVVHIHMAFKGSFYRKYLIHRICKLFKAKDIIHLHGSEFKAWYEGASPKNQYRIKRLLRECNLMVVLGNEYSASVKQIEESANTYILSNNIKIPAQRAKWNTSEFNVLFLGVMIKRKGVADLLNAIKIIKEMKLGQSMRFTIAGTGKEEKELKSLSESLGLNDIVDFTGWISGDEKERLIKESQLLVLPSYNEGLPMAILESISYGLPIVATDVGDVSAAVEEGVNGYLIKPGDVAGLADRIIRVSENEYTYQTMSEKSREIAETKFSIESYYDKILECYQQVKG